MIGSRPLHASTEPFCSAAQPSACCRFWMVTSLAERPFASSDCSRKKYGSVPLVAAICLPLRSFTEVMEEFGLTTLADHSGCEKMSMVLIAEPFERASSAAEPAVEPTSIAPERSASLALLEPADCTQLTVMSCFLSAFSSQPSFLMTKLSGL